MKKDKLLLLMLPAFLLMSALVSCDTDDPDPDAYDFGEETATGNWKIDSVVGYYQMKYFVLDEKFNGGSLNLREDGSYSLSNGDGSWSQAGSWKAGRWYVVLTVNGGEADTLNVLAPRNNDASSWNTHLDLYKVHQTDDADGDGFIVDKRVHMYTTKQ
jgi:hypothetical protein